jgi:hypothetical protein
MNNFVYGGIIMKKKHLFLIIILIFIVNITFSYNYISLNIKEKNYYLIKMYGKGTNWEITDYQFIYLSDYSCEQGNAKFNYLNNSDEINGKITIELYDYFKKGTEPHLTSSFDYDKNKEYFQIGSGNCYPPDNLTLKEIQNNTYFIVKWEEKDGTVHKEQINLKFDYDLPIIKSIINQESNR